MSVITPDHYIILASLLFTIGVIGVMTRRNALVLLMSVELMLNAANLAFVAGSRAWSSPGSPDLDGPIFAIFVILVAAAEAAVGLALVIAVYRLHRSVDLERLDELSG